MDLESDDVMSVVVKHYCSFFHYHMLEHIIEELGTSKDKENLAAYKKIFKEYARCCVIEGPLEVGKRSEEGASNNRIKIVTLDDSFNNCTRHYIRITYEGLLTYYHIISLLNIFLSAIVRAEAQ